MKIRVKILLFVVFIAIIGFIPNKVFADTYGDLYYEVNEETNEITIMGVVNEEISEVIVPDKINNVVVTRIGNHAFDECTFLSNIEIPYGIKNIGHYAFYKCTSLRNLELPNTVRYIGDNAFTGCSDLTITMPDNVIISEYAFDGCEHLNIIYRQNDIIYLEDCTIDDIEEYEYTGEEITPDVVIKYKNNILRKDIDYILEYEDNIDEGTATVIIKGINNCIGEVTKEFEIVEIKILQELINLIPDEPIDLNIPEVEYEKAENIVVNYVKNIWKQNGIDLSKIDSIYTDEMPVYLGREDIYGITVRVIINDEYYTIKSIDLKYNNTNNYNIEDEQYVKNLEIGASPKYYPVDLDFLVEDDTTWGIWNKMFNIIGEYYTKQINDDSIVVKASAGAGGSDGSLNMWTWEGGTVLAIFKDGVFYDTRGIGSECTVPVINVPNTVSDSQLNDYIIQEITKYYYKEDGESIYRIEQGTDLNITNGYTVYASNIYEDEIKSYIIVNRESEEQQKSISECTIENIEEKTYTGNKLTQDIIVKDGQSILIEETDYTVQYKNNINAGTAIVTVIGIGKYTGTKESTFKINKATYDMSNVKFEGATVIYDGKSHSIIATGLPTGVNVTYKDNNKTNVGAYTVIAVFTGDYTNYNTISDMTATLKINSKNISSVSISSIGNQIYTGKDLKPSVTVKDGTITLKDGTDYTVSCTNNKNTGKATVTITGKGNYTGTKTTIFNIIPSQVKSFKTKSQKEKEITLQWTKNGGNVTGYKLYQYNSKTKKWYYVGKTSNTNYTIKKLTAGTNHKFKIRAYTTIDNKQYFGDYSSVLKTATKPSATKLKTLTTKNKKITVKWSKVSGTNGYEIYMSTNKNKGYSKIKNITKSSILSYTTGKLKKNKTYYFKIRAYKTVDGKKIYSSYSNIKQIKANK